MVSWTFRPPLHLDDDEPETEDLPFNIRTATNDATFGPLHDEKGSESAGPNRIVSLPPSFDGLSEDWALATGEDSEEKTEIIHNLLRTPTNLHSNRKLGNFMRENGTNKNAPHRIVTPLDDDDGAKTLQTDVKITRLLQDNWNKHHSPKASEIVLAAAEREDISQEDDRSQKTDTFIDKMLQANYNRRPRAVGGEIIESINPEGTIVHNKSSHSADHALEEMTMTMSGLCSLNEDNNQEVMLNNLYAERSNPRLETLSSNSFELITPQAWKKKVIPNSSSPKISFQRSPFSSPTNSFSASFSSGKHANSISSVDRSLASLSPVSSSRKFTIGLDATKAEKRRSIITLEPPQKDSASRPQKGLMHPPLSPAAALDSPTRILSPILAAPKPSPARKKKPLMTMEAATPRAQNRRSTLLDRKIQSPSPQQRSKSPGNIVVSQRYRRKSRPSGPIPTDSQPRSSSRHCRSSQSRSSDRRRSDSRSASPKLDHSPSGRREQLSDSRSVSPKLDHPPSGRREGLTSRSRLSKSPVSSKRRTSSSKSPSSSHRRTIRSVSPHSDDVDDEPLDDSKPKLTPEEVLEMIRKGNFTFSTPDCPSHRETNPKITLATKSPSQSRRKLASMDSPLVSPTAFASSSTRGESKPISIRARVESPQSQSDSPQSSRKEDGTSTGPSSRAERKSTSHMKQSHHRSERRLSGPHHQSERRSSSRKKKPGSEPRSASRKSTHAQRHNSSSDSDQEPQMPGTSFQPSSPPKQQSGSPSALRSSRKSKKELSPSRRHDNNNANDVLKQPFRKASPARRRGSGDSDTPFESPKPRSCRLSSEVLKSRMQNPLKSTTTKLPPLTPRHQKSKMLTEIQLVGDGEQSRTQASPIIVARRVKDRRRSDASSPTKPSRRRPEASPRSRRASVPVEWDAEESLSKKLQAFDWGNTTEETSKKA
jgi:hypothetical protein